MKTTEAGRQVYRKSLTGTRARKTLAASIAINLLDDIDELIKELDLWGGHTVSVSKLLEGQRRIEKGLK